MSNKIVEPVRVFKMGATALEDPDPSMSPDDVRKAFAVNFPALAAARVSGPEVSGEELVYTFEAPPAKVKG